ncbi:unnamed protein product [Leptosia nina]|uniref:Uncharacterized protein n=1 Tax=Leptosia nina TaxID=320188 RepID=A0AAV1J505_9NEOP
MPGLIGVGEFIEETREDYNSPTTSTFVSRIPQCRQTISALEETLDFDRDGLTKLKKAIKAIHNSGNAHVDNEMYLSRALERLGGNALSKDSEPDIGAAFFKFAVVTKELSALMKTLAIITTVVGIVSKARRPTLGHGGGAMLLNLLAIRLLRMSNFL